MTLSGGPESFFFFPGTEAVRAIVSSSKLVLCVLCENKNTPQRHEDSKKNKRIVTTQVRY